MTSLSPSHNLFRGQLVRLAAMRPEDKEIMARWYDDWEFLHLLSIHPARPKPASFFEGGADKSKDDHEFKFRIRTLAEDKLIGFVDLSVTWQHQSGWLALGIGEADYRGKGYGMDAMQLTLAYAFRELNLYRVELGVFSYNTRALHVYNKLGFVREGVSRSAVYRDGQRYDSISMGMLRPEWEQMQQNSR